MKNELNVMKSTKNLAIIGIAIAICVILVYTPLGMIPLPVVSLSIAHVPIIIMAIVSGPITGLIIGAIFGVLTLIKAYTMPAGFLDPCFQNPLISVLPRMLIGLVAYYGYRMFSKLNSYYAIAFGAAIGSMINTIGCLLMIYFLYAKVIIENVDTTAEFFIYGVITTYGIPEMLACVIISVIVIKSLKKVFKI